ncbi:glycosyltransferase involved in cell wall bisynthesis [Rhizobium subbaraonis]|uniref:Glycosyltransferase involved in cell wall bisynthesis n=1 Tax=Rhizobium subbaraonis TaxID=908946 RepID=A0A285U1B4_9HYPH|nr:glycosyltransferase family 4 protein [Rhizobium subbaraonis]SOC35740.1 glycosyltransferase involved in cell wall bisynthesis [Rhizobium subbaraonis]
MRVAHIKSRYGRIGGIESLLEGLMPELARQPDAEPLLVFVADRRDRELEARLTGNGTVPLVWLPWNGLASSPLSAMRLTRILREQKIDVIHTHDMRANLLVAMSRPILGIPWLCHMHGWLGHTHKGVHRFYEAVDRRLVGLADHVLVGSYAALEEVRRGGARSSSVAWNAAAIAAPAMTSRRDLGLPPEVVVCTVLGRLHPGKGQDIFLKALGNLATHAGWHAVLVGVGETEAELKQMAATLGIADRVTFTGFVDRPTDWIDASDVIVVPSRKDSLPMTCLEGMARAKALIVSAAGDMPRVIADGEAGLVVAIDDVDGLRAALVALLDAPVRREVLGQAARARFLAHHTAAALARQMTDSAMQLTQAKGRPVRR